MNTLLLLGFSLFMSFFSVSEDKVSFTEHQWQPLSSCEACAECQEKTSDKIERTKLFSFYKGEQLLGKWHLLEIQLLECGELQYRTLNIQGTNIGPSTFGDVDTALLDICREVRETAPGANGFDERDCKDRTYSEFIVQNWNKPFPEHGKNTELRN